MYILRLCDDFYPFRQVLEDMEMVSAFTAVLHVPNLSHPDHLMAVLEESDVFSKKDLSNIQRKIQGHRLSSCWCTLRKIVSARTSHRPFRFRVFIGIKKLLALIDMARQTEEQYRVVKFLSKLEDEGGLDMGSSIMK